MPLFKKYSKYYYKCNYELSCNCFKNHINRRLLINANEVGLNELLDINIDETVVLEEHSNELKVFYDFEEGGQAKNIVFSIKEDDTIDLDEFRLCERECIVSNYRAIYGKKLMNWIVHKSKIGQVAVECVG